MNNRTRSGVFGHESVENIVDGESEEGIGWIERAQDLNTIFDLFRERCARKFQSSLPTGMHCLRRVSEHEGRVGKASSLLSEDLP